MRRSFACGFTLVFVILSRDVQAEGRARYGGAVTVTWSGALAQIEPFVLDSITRLSTAIEPVAQQPLRARLRVRKGLKFHGGRGITATDVVAALVVSLRSQNAWMLAPIVAARALSPDTIELELSSAASVQTLREALATPAAYVRAGADEASRLVGTGAFRVERTSPQELRLVANGEYFAGRPYLDVLSFRKFSSDADERASFELGSLDVASAVRVGLSGKRRPGAFELEAKPSEIVAILVQGRLATPTMVEGLAAAVDRERLRRLAFAAPSSVFPGRVDLAAARAKLGAGTSAKLAFDRDMSGMRVAAERLLADLSVAGVAITLDALTAAELEARVVARSCELCLVALTPPLPGKTWQDGLLRGPLSRAILLALRGRRYFVSGSLVGLRIDALGRLLLEDASLEPR